MQLDLEIRVSLGGGLDCDLNREVTILAGLIANSLLLWK